MSKKEKIKINKKNLFKEKAGISYLQILILLVASFAFSYIVHESSKGIDEVYENNKEEIERLEQVRKEAKNNLLVDLARWWLSRSKINLVSAQENVSGGFAGFERVNLESLSLACCPKLKDNVEGASSTCQDILVSECKDKCSVSCLPTRCSQTSSCKLGCCIDEKEGICSTSAAKQDCQAGIWKEDKNCNADECRLGCCILGRQTQFITEKRCERLSAFYSLPVDFKGSISSEIECLALSNQQDEGACIIEAENDAGKIERTCKFASKVECVKMTQSSLNFHENYLCSNPELKTNCEKQKTTNCVEGKDEVYWFDSCGNRENIYSSDKDKSYNQGKVLKKENSCSSNSGNIDSKECGNCNYFLGSVCGKGKATEGNYACQDLNCKDAPANVGKKDRKNGESWCVYDGYIGEGKDVPGSRHWKYYCIDGQVKVEGCGDYRTGLCVESEIDLGNNKKFSNAACRPNRAMECVSYNAKEENEDKEELKKECEENSDCRILNMDFGKKYQFSVCAPKYPGGFELNNNPEAAKQICKQADFKCIKIMVKELSGWKCIAGCECDSASFTKKMNEWCASMGDCGLSVNVAGKVTDDGYSVHNAPKLKTKDYEKYSQALEGQRAEPGNFSELMAAMYGWGASTSEEYIPEDTTSQIMLGSVGAGGIGALAVQLSVIGGLEAVGGSIGYIFGTSLVYNVLASFGSAALSVVIGAAIGLIVAKIFGLQGEAVIVTVIAGAAAAITITIVSLTGAEIAPVACFDLISCLIVIAIVILVAAVMKLMGIGKVKKTVVTFSCRPWQAPRGGDDCGKCNEELVKDGLRKCSKYRCQSLGQTCEFINEGTGKELCVDMNPGDVTSPGISPWYGLISPGYKYSEVTEDGFKLVKENNECIPEFTPVIFGLETNEPAQCRYDAVHTQNYEEMEFYFGDDNLYLYNHTMAFNMPSVESLLQGLEDELNATDLENLKSISIQKLGNLTFYVRCVDKKDNSNLKEYLIKTCVKPGHDLTAPYVTYAQPLSGSYLAYNQTSQELKVYVNEPANCKFNYNDTDYNLMKNELSCLTDYEDAELYGWGCVGNLNDLGKGENKIYIKCKDQPWLPDENKSRNAMKESFVFILKQSENELKIDKIEPNGTIKVGTEPASAILKVQTSGGAENGKAVCSFSFTGYDSMIDFLDTYSNVHTQVFNQLIEGDYNIYVECKDAAKNIAKGKTNLGVKIDKTPPKIIRVYNSGMLKIITDEDAECVYSDKCNFVWKNATKMTGLLREHEASWNKGEIYYIKCKDLWENKPDNCFIAKAV